jgi:hypothetical protein
MSDDAQLAKASLGNDGAAWSELCQRHVPACTAYLGWP